MKERLYRILNIKHSESSQVFDLLAVQFFMGLAIAFLNIIAFSLFIYNFSVQTLPIVYLSAAVLLFLSNIGYEKIEHKFSPPKLLKVIIGFSVVLLIALWVGLTFGNKNDFIFLLLLGSTLIYMIIGFAFWGLVSLLFNVRESRRVFSVVGAGDTPAKLIGYIAAPLLIPYLGLSNMIWITVFLLIMGLIIFHKLLKKKSWVDIHHKSHVHHAEPKDVIKGDIISFFFKDKLIFTISLLSILSYNVFILIDYTFIAQVKVRFQNIADLAVYIATFFALGRVIAIVFKFIFTSRVIERLGVIVSLFITPVTLFLFCVVFLIFGGLDEYNVYVFGVMALLTEVLRSTMQEPVFFILFQPLKEQLRLKGHIISKGYMMPPSLIIVGLSLLFLYKTNTPITILFTIKIILLNLFIWAVIILFVQKSYLKTLHTSIKKGYMNSEDYFLNDQTGIGILLKKVESSKKLEVIYALNLLEKAGYPQLDALLFEQLKQDKDVEVKKYVLDELDKKKNGNTSELKKLLAHEQVEEVKHKMISILCKSDADFLKSLSDDISEQHNEIKKIVIVNMINQKKFNYLFLACTEMDKLINSTDPEQRMLAVKIISEVKHVQFNDVIEVLINDINVSVRRRAIAAACNLKIKSLLPLILDLSETPANKYLVLKSLQVYGDDLFKDVEHLPAKMRATHSSNLIKIAGKIKGDHSTRFLLAALDTNSGKMMSVLHALWNKEYEPNSNEGKERLKVLLNTYISTGLSKINDYNGMSVYQECELLKSSIHSEVKGDLMCALKICVMLFDKKELNRVLELMDMEGNAKLFNAMEMLELMLPQKISVGINQLFDFVLDPAHKKLAVQNYEMRTFLHKVFETNSNAYNPWTKAVCIYCTWLNKESDLLKMLNNHHSATEDFIITETKNYVFNNKNSLV